MVEAADGMKISEIVVYSKRRGHSVVGQNMEHKLQCMQVECSRRLFNYAHQFAQPADCSFPNKSCGIVNKASALKFLIKCT